jgi:hypothetical protein
MSLYPSYMKQENQEIVQLVVTSTISVLRKFRVKILCFSFDHRLWEILMIDYSNVELSFPGSYHFPSALMLIVEYVRTSKNLDTVIEFT